MEEKERGEEGQSNSQGTVMGKAMVIPEAVV